MNLGFSTKPFRMLSPVDQQQGLYRQDVLCAPPLPGVCVAEKAAPEKCRFSVSSLISFLGSRLAS